MESVKIIKELSEFYKIFSDTTRLRIIEKLLEEKCCVSKLSEDLQISQSAVSHQLKTLRQSNLVKTNKIGQNVVYELADHHIEGIFKYGLEHIKEKI